MRKTVYKNNTALRHLLHKNQIVDLQKCGVYKIGFFGTDGFYIGSTTESFNIRFLRHFRNLKSNSHCNKILQRAYCKYNEMYLEILEVCEPEQCIVKEQYYIDKLKPKYNICKLAGNTLGVKPSKKALELSSKKVDMFNLEGNLIQTFQSRREANRKTGICDSCIAQAIKNKGIASGFQFRNHGEFTKLPKYENPLTHKVLVYNKFGVFIKQYPSILKASKEMNIPVGNICKHLKNHTRLCYGYVFKYYKENFPLRIQEYERIHKNQQKVIVTDLKTNKKLVFDSLRSVDVSIMSRSSIHARRKKEGNIFYVKGEYRIEIITCKPNEVAET